MQNVTLKQVCDNAINQTPALYELHQALLLEVPVAICINGISQAVMMVSPTHLKDFAFGFALSEGLIDSIKEVLDVKVQAHESGWQVDLQVLNRTQYMLKQRRRMMAGPSGCGLCGIKSINAAMSLKLTKNTDTTGTKLLPSDKIIQQAKDALPNLLRKAGSQRGNHSAAFFNCSGEIIAIRDDVGRHSALDKLLGHLSKHQQVTNDGFVLITSRCSHDLVAKAARLSLTTLVTLAQPTDLAVSAARNTQLALFCFQNQQLKRFA